MLLSCPSSAPAWEPTPTACRGGGSYSAPETPAVPVVDWQNIACGADGAPCINYDGSDDAKLNLKTQAEFLSWNSNYSFRDDNSLVHYDYNAGVDGSTMVLTSLDGIEGVVYAAQTGANGSWEYPNRIFDNTNNTLYVNLGHADKSVVADVNGSASDLGTWVAAVGRTGSAEGNRLLIKDSNLRHAANIRSSGSYQQNSYFALAAVSNDAAIASDGVQYLDSVSYKDNLVFIDNSSVLKAQASPLGYRNSIRTVVMNGGLFDSSNPSFNFDKPVYAVNNGLVINQSRVEAYLIATNYTYRYLHNVDTHSEDGYLIANESELVLGLNTGAAVPRNYFTVASGFTHSESNAALVQNSTVTADFAGIGADVNSDVLLAAVLHGNRSYNNSFIFMNSSLSAVNEAAGAAASSSSEVLPVSGINERGVEMFAVLDEVYQSYIFGRSADSNTLWVTADSGRNSFDVENSSLVLGGARAPNYWTITDEIDPSGSAVTSVSGNKAVVENTDFNSGANGFAAVYGGMTASNPGYDLYWDRYIESLGRSEVNNNSVSISGSTFSGGRESVVVAGGRAYRGTASGNQVSVVDSTFSNGARFYGAVADASGVLTGNSVVLENVRLGEGSSVYGAVAGYGTEKITYQKGRQETPEEGVDPIVVEYQSELTGNHVVIGENVTALDGVSPAKFDALAGGVVVGGHLESFGDQTAGELAPGVLVDAFTGNTLTVYSPVDTKTLKNFQNYQFVLTPENIRGGALITVSGDEGVTFSTEEGRATQIQIGYKGEGSLTDLLNQEITLIDSGSAGFVDLNGNAVADGDYTSLLGDNLVIEQAKSVARTTVYTVEKDDLSLKIEDQDLKLTLAGADSGDRTNPETDSMMQSSLSVLGAMFSADDLLLERILRTYEYVDQGLFAAGRVHYNNMNASSELTTTVTHGLFGGARHLPKHNAYLGGFIEMGTASYDTKETITSSDGRSNFAGGGLFIKKPLVDQKLDLSGYLKFGFINNKAGFNIAGEHLDVDENSLYYGASVDLSYKLVDNPGWSLKTFATYIYDHNDEVSFAFGTQGALPGAQFNYDALDAHRTQLGAVLNVKREASAWSPYVGLTWEYLWNAEATGTAVDAEGALKLKSSDINGHTGIVSAGWTYKPADGGMNMSFGVNGYAGERRGVDFSMHGVWLF